MRIAVDVMGGDLGPEVIVQGAVKGASRYGVDLLLVGDEDAIRHCLASLDVIDTDIEIRHAMDVIEMDEHPAQAVRRKPQASMNLAMATVKSGDADAMLSPGNSGAMMASALVYLGRIAGIDRPAITSGVPNGAGGATIMVDLGAVTDPRPEHLVQWAHMATVYGETVLKLANPSVGLLSNGEEASKGNALVQKVYPLLDKAAGINFVGNVEGRDILTGEIDIVVTDGFTGNVVLKSIEGTASMLMRVIRHELTSSLTRKLAAAVLRPAFRAVSHRLDSSSIGGAPLLGVNGVVIITHGSSNQVAIENAVRVASVAAEHDLPGTIRARIEQASVSTTIEH